MALYKCFIIIIIIIIIIILKEKILCLKACDRLEDLT